MLVKTNEGNSTLHPDTLNYLAHANQLGLSATSSNLSVCSFPCQKSYLQPRTLCGLIKPMCPVLKFTCRLCKFYLPITSCTKACKTSKKFCAKSGCNDFSPNVDGKKITSYVKVVALMPNMYVNQGEKFTPKFTFCCTQVGKGSSKEKMINHF